MTKYFTLFLLMISGACFAQKVAVIAPQRMVTFKNPAALSAPKGYSQAAEIDMGASKMIIMAGQIALDKTGALVGKGDMAAQTEQAFKNIQHIVTEAGGTMNDIVKLTYYIKDVSKIQEVRAARDKFINTQTPTG